MSELGSVFEIGVDIAEADAPELLPVGEYLAEVRSAEAKISQSGNKYISVAFYVSPEEFPPDYEIINAPDGKTLSWNRVPLPEDGTRDKKAVYRLRKFMESIGAPFEGGTLDLAKWVGLKARIKLVHESYEGETRETVRSVERDV